MGTGSSSDYSLIGLLKFISSHLFIFSMIEIKTKFNNCSSQNAYLFDGEALSSIEFVIQIDKALSVQSKSKSIKELRKKLHQIITPIVWIIGGEARLSIAFYLSNYNRATTDKSADLDNMLKPLIDSFAGQSGILVDDSQISSIDMIWLSRNDEIDHDIIRMEFKYNNEEVYQRKNLYFVQCHKALYCGFNIDTYNFRNLFSIKMIISARKRLIKLSMHPNIISRTSLLPILNIHRSRLNGYDSSSIITTQQFNQICLNNGLTFKFFREYVQKVTRKS
jgi:Holliday junction resolvase RusA-like endonuclease